MGNLLNEKKKNLLNIPSGEKRFNFFFQSIIDKPSSRSNVDGKCKSLATKR